MPVGGGGRFMKKGSLQFGVKVLGGVPGKIWKSNLVSELGRGDWH